MILGLFPGLSTTGGVPRTGRLTAAVLATFAAERDEPYDFLSLNDPAGTPPLQIGSQQIAITGFGRSKGTFLRTALRAAFVGPSLVVAFHPNLAPVVAAIKMFAPRTRTIIFAHGVEVWTPLGSFRRWSLRRSDLVLAPSAYTVSQLVTQQGIAAERTRKLAWSLGPEFDSQPNSFAGLGPPVGFPSGRVVLTIGRWDASEAYKGVDVLIAALPGLLRAVPEVHLVAIGGGNDLPRLQRLANESGVAQHIHFLPFLDPEELWSAYDYCDVFALPSRGEGFGLVFLEAMAHAKPVIGGAHGGTPEIIEDGKSGYLVPHGDVNRLTELLQILLTDELSRCQMGTRALERVHRDFMFSRFSGEFRALLENLLVT